MVDDVLDSKRIVIVNDALEVSYIRDSETVKEIEEELVFEDFWEDGLDTRSQAHALLESFQSRKYLGGK